MSEITANLQMQNTNIHVNINSNPHCINAYFEPHGGEQYTGEYTIIPMVKNQTLKTQNKRMLLDVEILAIPYYETSNAQNGKTIIIGG